MRHIWKVAAGFLIAGLLVLWLGQLFVLPDSFATPAVLTCAVGFPACVLLGSVTHRRE